VNIGLAVTLVRAADPAGTAPGLVTAYSGAYAVGAVGSYLLLRHVLGGLETPQLLRFLARLVVTAGGAAAVGWAVGAGLEELWAGDAKVQALTGVVLVGGSAAATYLLLSRLLRVPEVTAVVGLVTRRRGR
jgi:putative peptidoglycan lipid II flippase